MTGMESNTRRPTWTNHFIAAAVLASTMSTCKRRHVGAVIVRDNRQISSGFNGAPVGSEHCDVTGCLREEMGIPSGERLDICRASHSESNAIAQAARFGISVEGATMYVTTMPCRACARLIVQSGIRKVIYSEGYNDDATASILAGAGVELVKA